jgi:hypothetical protein
MAGNRAARALSFKKLKATLPGHHVIDANMDIALRKSGGDRWAHPVHGEMTSTQLWVLGPIKPWTGVSV